MTTIALYSDIHANLPALEAAFDQTDGVDEHVVLGDIVGHWGFNEACVEFVRANADSAVFGNHDAYIRNDFEYVPDSKSRRMEYGLLQEQLSDESIEWLTSLPETLSIGSLDAAHANPYDEPHHGYVAENYVSDAYWTKFGATHMDGGIAAFGHTHSQKCLDLEAFDGQSGLVVNPGSVGGHIGTAEYAILDVEQRDVSLKSVEYDTAPVDSKLEETGMSDVLDERNSRNW